MVQVVVQFVDFLMKAVISYAKTAEGQKEFDDILQAADSAGIDVDGAWAEISGNMPTETREEGPKAGSNVYAEPTGRVKRTPKGE